jgi:protein-L-isoaspartate(D-aspartate) O-methyltransferase
MAALDLSPAPLDFGALRRTMVDCQIRTFDVTDQTLLAQFAEVPRERFLPGELAALAYSDVPLKLKMAAPDGTQRTLLPPLILARMMQAADVQSSDKVLDIAAGTGYSTAIFAGLGREVVALESDPALAQRISTNLATLGSSKARALSGPLAAGLQSESPFDLIFINGAVETDLAPLFAQLREGGRLVAIKAVATGPGTVRANRAVRYQKVEGGMGWRYLFDASAPVLADFRAGVAFVF